MRLADRIATDAFKLLPHAEEAPKREVTNRTLERFGLNAHSTEEEFQAAIAADPAPKEFLEQELRDVKKQIHGATRELMENHRAHQAALVKLIRLIPIVVAQNVYQWVCAPEQDQRPLSIWDMPCLAPKWESFWTEWEQANGQTIGMLATLQSDDPEMIYPRGERTQHPDQPALVDEITHQPGTGSNGLQAYEHYWTSDNLPDVAAWDDVHWVWRLSFFAEKDRDIYGPIVTWFLPIDRNGKCLDLTWSFHTPVDDDEAEAADMMSTVVIWAQALSFLNCRNVETVYREPSPGEQKRHRKKRKADHPLVSYNLISIQPTGKAVVNRSAGTSDDERAFHIAGGSIAHYGDCCPGPTGHAPKGLLFGKLEGIYYRPPHVKGNPRHGIVASDYEIQAPK